MELENIKGNIKEVNLKLEVEYCKLNQTADPYIIEECIWTIKGLETRLNNLYTEAKKHSNIKCNIQ